MRAWRWFPDEDRTYLAGQPVDRLPLDERALGHLRMLGIGTIGAFAGLPANAVRTRYGTEGALAWRLAHGEDPQPLTGRTQPIVLREAIDFEWEEHNVDRLTFALQALAQRLATRLARRGLMAQQVGSRIERADGTVQQFSLDLPEPSGSAASLRDAARWRLEAWAGIAQTEAVQEIPLHRPGVVRIGLDVQQLVPGAGTQRSLLGNRSERVARANHAISRLRAQLGDDAVFRMELCPEAWTLEAAGRRVDAYVATGAEGDLCITRGWLPGRPSPQPSPTGRGSKSGRALADERRYAKVSQGDTATLCTAWLAGVAGGRGLTRLFAPPRPVRISRIDGASRVTLEGTTRKVVARYGPQRVQTGWWAKPVDRDYLHVRLDDGRGLVLYRDRIKACWFAQGVLD